MQLQRLNSQTPEAQAIITLSDSYILDLYPLEDNLESIQGLQSPNVFFIGGYLNGELVACGAVKIMNDDGCYGEIKRLFVVEQHRGQGLSKLIIAALENHLCQSGVPLARLETGVKQPIAIALYKKLGYVVRGPFGSYMDHPLSVFMEKPFESCLTHPTDTALTHHPV